MTRSRWICPFLIIIIISALPMVIFADKIGITGFSIPAICLFAFHILYGLTAFMFRHKGNYLRFNYLFIKHFLFNLFEPDKDYTYTSEYREQFYRMLVQYFIVIPLYIPCIFFTSSPAAMPIALIVFLIPQGIFIFTEVKGLSHDINRAKQKRVQENQEKLEQERREKMGRWK